MCIEKPRINCMYVKEPQECISYHTNLFLNKPITMYTMYHLFHMLNPIMKMVKITSTLFIYSVGVKGKVHPRTDREGPDGE
jgi:hypothetical protein